MRRIMVAAAALVLASGSAAADWSAFGDWNTFGDTRDTGEDVRMTCTAWTGGDGNPSLEFVVTDGDAGPPASYPLITYVETGYRGIEPRIRESQALTLTIDGGPVFKMRGYIDMMDPGIYTGKAAPDRRQAEAAWNAVRQGSIATVSDAQSGETWERFSLAGSYAASLRMLDTCGLAD